MKKTFILFAITALIVFAIVQVTLRNQRQNHFGNSYQVTCFKDSQQTATPDTQVCAINVRQEAEQSANRPSTWELLTAWPEGITAWLLLLTLIAVAWQAWETRQSAEIANKTLISTLRPRIIVRKIDMHWGTNIPTVGKEDADPWRVDFVFANVGQGSAHILEHEFFIGLRTPFSVKTPRKKIDARRFHLEPGEDRNLSIPMDEQLINILRLIDRQGLRLEYQGTEDIYFFGNVRYADNTGTERSMEVCRRYDNASARFKPVDDPDREHSE